jgi:hypothetical protein
MNPRFPLLVSALTGWALVGCADLTAPSPYSGSSAAASAPAPVAAPAPSRPAAPTPPRDEQPLKNNLTRVRASHILIAYKGARRATATRSKEEAKQLATQLWTKLKGGADFAKVAGDNSDDSGNKGKGGDLGLFDRNTMAKPFSDAAFALDVGQTSEVVETEFGFHIIKRTE